MILDPEADAIREEVERISGIGEQTSWDIAAAFDSRQELRSATQQDLESIPNVGEQRAKNIRD